MRGISRRLALQAGAAWAFAPGLVAPRRAQATEAELYADARLIKGEPPRPEPGGFTMVVLPDTQNYVDQFPAQFRAQTAWIAENRKRRNILSVLHLGDVTNRNSVREWQRAVCGLRILEDQVPFVLLPGNHDYGWGGDCQDRTSHLSEHFPVEMFRRRSSFGGVYDREPERIDNSYHLFSAGELEFLVLALEFGPRRDVIRWANEVVSQHPHRAAILTTHAYLYYDDCRYDWTVHGPRQAWNPHDYPYARGQTDDVSDGEQLWTDLVSRHENFIMTINGHVLNDGLGRMTSATPGGRAVHQMLVNFQMKPRGGDGWLRLLNFLPDGRMVEVCDYSPTRKERNISPQNRFTLALAPVS